ncbi:hypothetical protein M9Y10_036672 [Tritrichomonas musculus]|uniref:Protein kinase domain-containing protein n=1 Tax=Tritrichomonas musculus TaxID=1915356 RepID=A0ABR2GUB1_9EUKA
MDELDLTEELKLFYPEIRQMMIPRYIFSYTVDKKIYENTSVLIVTAFSDKTPKGKRIALKCVPKDYFNEDLQTLFDGVSHPNILPIYDIFGFPEENPRFYCICMPFIDTDLQSYFHGVCHRSLSEMDVCQIMEELFKAVFYIHSLGICHMDLKPSNILIQKIKSRLKPFLIDFDYAYQIPNSSFVSVAPRGTYLYAAPETLRSTELKFLSEATSMFCLINFMRLISSFEKNNEIMYEVWRLIYEGAHLSIYRKWSHQKKKKSFFFVN